MSDGVWWERFFRTEAILSLLWLVGSSGAVGLLLTLWASVQDSAPTLTSVGWLFVALAVTGSVLFCFGLALWCIGFLRRQQPRPRAEVKDGKLGVACGFLKHTAPRQDDLPDGSEWERVCVGVAVDVSGSKVVRGVKARVEVYDPSMWCFHNQVFYQGDLMPGEDVECYPIEIHIHRATDRLRYMRDGKLVFLGDDEELSVRLLVTSLDFPDDPVDVARAVRHTKDSSERFVLDEDSTH